MSQIDRIARELIQDFDLSRDVYDHRIEPWLEEIVWKMPLAEVLALASKYTMHGSSSDQTWGVAVLRELAKTAILERTADLLAEKETEPA